MDQEYSDFTTRKEAEEYVAAGPSKLPARVTGPTKWYAVVVGRSPHDTGVYSLWRDVEPRVIRVSGARHKGNFKTKADTEAYLLHALADLRPDSHGDVPTRNQPVPEIGGDTASRVSQVTWGNTTVVPATETQPPRRGEKPPVTWDDIFQQKAERQASRPSSWSGSSKQPPGSTPGTYAPFPSQQEGTHGWGPPGIGQVSVTYPGLYSDGRSPAWYPPPGYTHPPQSVPHGGLSHAPQGFPGMTPPTGGGYPTTVGGGSYLGPNPGGASGTPAGAYNYATGPHSGSGGQVYGPPMGGTYAPGTGPGEVLLPPMAGVELPEVTPRAPSLLYPLPVSLVKTRRLERRTPFLASLLTKITVS